MAADEQQKCCPKDDSGNFLTFRNPYTNDQYTLECVDEKPQVNNDLCTSMVYVTDELDRGDLPYQTEEMLNSNI